jgi:hypothetical protein
MKNSTIILFLMLFISNIVSAQINNGLVLQMLFNGDAKDQTNYNNNGKLMGSTVYGEDRFGCECGAIGLNGINAYVTVPSSKTLSSPNKGITIATWLKVNAGTEYRKWLSICCKGDVVTEDSICPQYRFQATTITLSANTSFTESINTPFDFGIWYHYAMTYNGSMVSLYVNGVFVFQYPYTGQLQSNNMPLEIGRDMPGNLEYFNGSLDDFRIYNRALSVVEIASLFQDNSEATSAKPCVISKKINTNKTIPMEAKGTTLQPEIAPNSPKETTKPQVQANPQVPVLTGTPPFIKFQNVKGQKTVQTTQKSMPITAKVTNVTDKVQIAVQVNGNDYPFTFDNKTHIVSFDLQLDEGKNRVEVFAANTSGQYEEFITIDREVIQPIVQAPEKQIKKPKDLISTTDPSPVYNEGKYNLVKEDKIIINQSVEVPSSTLTITCYDHDKIDGDTVSIILNGLILFDNIALKPQFHKSAIKEITLMRGTTYNLIAKSINEGKIPTNTMTIEVSDKKGFLKTIKLNSKKGTSEGVELIYK